MSGQTSGEVTCAIAEFAAGARFGDLPDAVLARVRIHILDTLGLALAGARSDAARLFREHLADQGAFGNGCAIFGTALRAAPRFAAAANAAAAHADNFDDTTPQARAERTGGIHTSGAVLPAVLALGEMTGADGRSASIAYHVGVEVASRLSHAIGERHYGDGFHTTGTLNVFGVAVAAGVLLGFDAETHAAAVSLCASRAAGVRRNFGSMAEILHPAHAAEDGLVAADLARRGVTAAADALDGPVGYFAAAAGGADPGEIVGRLGAPWVFEDPGVWIKPHPNGALTHPGAGCLLGLLRANDVAATDIAAIRVRTNPRVLATLIHHDPKDAMQAKFSMEFTLAVVALDRKAGLGEFTDAALARADLRDMMARVDYGAYQDGPPDYTNVTTLIEVDLVGGGTLAGRADFARGSTGAPMGWSDIRAKFEQCAAYGGHPEESCGKIGDIVAAFDRQASLDALSNALAVTFR